MLTQSGGVGLSLCVGFVCWELGRQLGFGFQPAGPALGDAPTQLYLCVNLLSAHNCTPGTFRNLFTSPVAPDPFRICQGEIGGAGVALSHLGHPGDIPGSDESGSDNREKNKS